MFVHAWYKSIPNLLYNNTNQAIQNRNTPIHDHELMNYGRNEKKRWINAYIHELMNNKWNTVKSFNFVVHYFLHVLGVSLTQ